MLRPGMPEVQQRLTRARRQDREARARAETRAAAVRPSGVADADAGAAHVSGTFEPCVRHPSRRRFRSSSPRSPPRWSPRAESPRRLSCSPTTQDYGYFLTLLDSVSMRSLAAGELGRVQDGFLRTMLWGALWDQVRDAQLAPERFADLALARTPARKGRADRPRAPRSPGALDSRLHCAGQDSGDHGECRTCALGQRARCVETVRRSQGISRRVHRPRVERRRCCEDSNRS